MSIESGNSITADSLLVKDSFKQAEHTHERSLSAQDNVMREQVDQEVKQAEAMVDTEKQMQAVEALLKVAQNLNQDIQFNLESAQANTPVIQVVDRVSGDIIRQIPTEEFLELASRMQSLTKDEQLDSATGLLINSRV